jgi:hypothetical protein
MPLLATAPAMVAGFFANYILDIKYLLKCDTSYVDRSEMCFDDVCCVAYDSHSEWISFMSSLASTLLAIWGVIKVIGVFASEGDNNLKENDTEFVEKVQSIIPSDDSRKEETTALIREFMSKYQDWEEMKQSLDNTVSKIKDDGGDDISTAGMDEDSVDVSVHGMDEVATEKKDGGGDDDNIAGTETVSVAQSAEDGAGSTIIDVEDGAASTAE